MMSDTNPHLSIVIPAYCEEVRLAKSLPVVLEYLNSQSHPWEIVIVDDGSPDRTSEVAGEMLAGTDHQILRNEPNAGKGASIKRGMLAARGAFVLFSDADLSTPIDEIEKFWPAFEAGADVAFGSRAVATSDIVVHQPMFRELSGRAFNLCVRMIALPGVADSQCGFKMFNRRAVDLLFPLQSMTGFAFDVELLAMARAAGLKLAEVGVKWIDSPDSRVSMGSALQAFADLIAVRRRVRALRCEGKLKIQEGDSV